MFPKKTKFIIYILVVVAAFLLLFLPSGSFIPLKFSVVNLVSLPVRAITFPLKEIKKMLYYHRTYREYIRLREEVTILRGRLEGLDEVLLENSRLEALLKFKRNLLFSSVAANVIERDPSNWNAAIVVDRGSEDGIGPGMPVVNAMGVVGKVSEVGDHKAKVVLMTDPSFSVPALAKRSREIGLVSGTLTGMSRMRYLSLDADVQKGDEIITSKLSTSFPEGLLIGEVVSVSSSERSPTIDCIIQPAVSLSQLEEVLIIKK